MRTRGSLAVAALLLLAPGRPLPAAGEVEEGPVVRRVAFGSGADQSKKEPIWDAILRFRPDLFILAGDSYSPTRRGDMKERARDFAKLAALPTFQKLRQSAMVVAVWGAKDFGLDDPSADPGSREEIRKGFLDLFDIPPASPRRSRRGIYDAQILGPPGRRIQVILLDTRFNRTPLKKRSLLERSDGPYARNEDPFATYLGEEQWAFLREQLLVPADLRLVVSDIQVVVEEEGYEKWANFPLERERLLQLFRETRAAGIVILSGGRHLAELSKMDAGLGYPLLEASASGLNEAAYNLRPQAPNRHRIENPIRHNNFGAVIVDWERSEPRVTIELRDEDGAVPLSYAIPLAGLRPKAATSPHPTK